MKVTHMSQLKVANVELSKLVMVPRYVKEISLLLSSGGAHRPHRDWTDG
jgi:hypothetical protein